VNAAALIGIMATPKSQAAVGSLLVATTPALGQQLGQQQQG